MNEFDKVSDSASPERTQIDVEDLFRAYLEYNRVLRTWFVAFGIGGPALFLVYDKIAKRLAIAGQLKLVVTLFLVGACAQVIGALLNKVANWYVYRGTIEEGLRTTRSLRLADWFIGRFWPDIVLDVVTIVSFGVATWLVFTVFTKVVCTKHW